MAERIHIFGASGSGVTTLGRAVAGQLRAPFLDTDSYYWKRTDPPFAEKNPPALRVELIERKVSNCRSWVLAGSMCSWGDWLLPRFTLAVFLHLDPSERMARLESREKARYGRRILPGGDMHGTHTEFVAWARSYDTATRPTRSLDLHESWIEGLSCPVLRLDSRHCVGDLIRAVMHKAESAQVSIPGIS